MKIKQIILCFILTGFLVACGKPEDGEIRDLKPKYRSLGKAQKEWSLFVYMEADNDLEEDAVNDLEELRLSGAEARAHVVVMIDRCDDYTDAEISGIGDFTGAKILELQNGQWTEIEDLGEVDSNSVDNIRDFLVWGFTEYKSAHSALVFWDHGGGWQSFGSDETAYDSSLSAVQIAKAVEQSLKAAKRTKLDIIGFDACLMGNYESALAFTDVADYYLASSELEPGHGWDHTSWSVLAESSDPRAVGRQLIEGFFEQSKEQETDAEITLSLIDLKAISRAEEDIRSFVKKLPSLPISASLVGRLQSRVQGFARSPNADEDPQLVDFVSLLEEMAKNDNQTAAAVEPLLVSLKSSVLEHAEGSARIRANGLSVYFPARRSQFDDSYELGASKQWQGFLDAYFSANSNTSGTFDGKVSDGDQAPPAVGDGRDFDFLDDEIFFETDDDGGYLLSGLLAEGYGNRVVDGIFYYGIDDGAGGIIYLGDEIADMDGDLASGYWDGTALVLYQGDLEAYGYLSFEYREDDYYECNIPLAYFEDGEISGDWEYVNLQILLDEDWEIVSQSYYTESGDNWSELRPKKGSIVVPIVEFQDADSDDGDTYWDIIEDFGFDATSEIDLYFEEMDFTDSQIYMELTVWDSEDNDATIYYLGTVD